MFEPSFTATIEPHPDAYEPLSPSNTPPPASPIDADEPPVKTEEPPAFPQLPPYDPFKKPGVNWHPDLGDEDTTACPCAPPNTPSEAQPYEPFALFQALGAAFAVGAAVGSLLTFSFSRRAVVEVISETV